MEKENLSVPLNCKPDSLVFRDSTNFLTPNRFCFTDKELNQRKGVSTMRNSAMKSERFFPRKSLSIIDGESQYESDLISQVTDQYTLDDIKSSKIEESSHNFDETQYLKSLFKKIKGNQELAYTERLLFRKISQLTQKLQRQNDYLEKIENHNKKLKKTNNELTRERNLERVRGHWLKCYSGDKESEARSLMKKQYRFKSRIVRVHNGNAFIKNGSIYVKLDNS